MPSEIISHFKEKPGLKSTWLPFWLGIFTIFSGPILGTWAAVGRPFINKNISEQAGIAISLPVVAAVLTLTITALGTSIRAFKKGERSWAMWAGFIPAILAGTFWVLMVIGEFVFPH